MTSDIPTFTLSNGKTIPWLAWGNGTGDAKKQVLEKGPLVLEVLNHIDTAQIYGTEQATGDVLEQVKPERSSVFITTKISSPPGEGGEKPGAKFIKLDELRDNVKGSIERLGTQPDLLLLHNPFVYPEGKLKEFWQILESLVESGELTASLGVSNFRPQDIEELLSFARIKPVVNQLEYHPWVLNHIDPILKLHEKYGIHTEAYGPLVPVLKAKTGGALGPVLKRISERLTKETGKDIDPATVLLLWTRAKGVTAVSSSGNDDRIRKLGATARLPDLLKKEDVEEIEREGRKTHYRFYKPHLETDFPAPDLPEDI